MKITNTIPKGIMKIRLEPGLPNVLIKLHPMDSNKGEVVMLLLPLGWKFILFICSRSLSVYFPTRQEHKIMYRGLKDFWDGFVQSK
jgi:hypothetical protein